MLKAFSDSKRFAQFLEESSRRLNDPNSYEQLNQRAERAGFKIVSILYNGYTSSQALQDMQDSAIQSRTNLRLNAEIEKQNNELANLKLESENKRFALQNQLNQLKADFEKKLEEEKATFVLEKKRMEHVVDLEIIDSEKQCFAEIEQMKNKIDEGYLKALSDLKVDLNKYECDLKKARNKIDRVYEIIN